MTVQGQRRPYTQVIVIGIDCATDPRRVGLALGRFARGHMRLEDALCCGPERQPADVIREWLEDRSIPALLALDAPLGWPDGLARALHAHRAGAVIDTEANNLFRRETDRFIQRELNKTPLDVGADRIARTAHGALGLLGELRRRLGAAIPLAWSPRGWESIAAIEVYPAATLITRSACASGYKKPAQGSQRLQIFECLRAEIDIGCPSGVLKSCADALDAGVCVLAAKDFLAGKATPPLNPILAAKEGWIWAAHRESPPR